MEKNVEAIDLEKYVRTGEGACGESYDSLEDSSVMLKLFFPHYPKESIFSELDVANRVYDLGVPSPKPGDLVKAGDRLGIRFRKIAGKRSFARMIADEPERVEEFSREFAGYCKRLHSVKCPEGAFPDVKSYYFNIIEKDKEFNSAQKQKLVDFVSSIPDADTALHGDMHIGNLISTLPKGAPMSAPHDVYFIDLGFFTRGYPLVDLGMLQNICLTADEEFRYDSFHIHKDMTEKVWKYFVDEYFDSKMTLAEANELIRPYESIKLLLVEYSIGYLPPHYKEEIKRTFGF